MRFIVLGAEGRPQGPSRQRACLLEPVPLSDDDYLTLYRLWFADGSGAVDELGTVKIGYADLVRDERPLEEGEFDELMGLDQRLYWFSLGQDATYYESISRLGSSVRVEILEGLRDMAFGHEAAQEAQHWDVTQTSLLRSVEPQTVEIQFRRIARGGSRLTAYHFEYVIPRANRAERQAEAWRLAFSVTPHSRPPSNIHVLIGRNGVGKTTLLGHIGEAVVNPHAQPRDVGEVVWADDGMGAFTNVVAVTFSAFDPAQEGDEAGAGQAEVDGDEGHRLLKGWDHDEDVPGDNIPPAESTEPNVRYTYVGLAKVDVHGRPTRERKSYDDLSSEFCKSVEEIHAAGRIGRWISALTVLSSDPHFYESPIHSFARDLLDTFYSRETRERARQIFSSLSSGHAIVLLTITRLVETVAEQSLVLLDEPEAHLHPPLLASFVRALSDLLTDRNGVALIGTHSPVVLQEVPRSCVWKVSRWDRHLPQRPTLQTYGENVGVLTHEVFGLEVRESGFHAEIAQAVEELGSFDLVMNRFEGQLGGEAKGLLRILLAHRNADGQY
ncbi:AAA family ATPase [Streptomyces antimicrobicus]|uniref:ATP-binding protein n=1 Tax=Streptomyces antimicrobicus TaxID=2883108 RepID=A0ABS8B5C1_9ACTN|nr:AAA family ATPase [Streptomyces antimicrobicus]MCB5179809.1 ATP-binding protein [Streptomyces antimicrobicus]